MSQTNKLPEKEDNSSAVKEKTLTVSVTDKSKWNIVQKKVVLPDDKTEKPSRNKEISTDKQEKSDSQAGGLTVIETGESGEGENSTTIFSEKMDEPVPKPVSELGRVMGIIGNAIYDFSIGKNYHFSTMEKVFFAIKRYLCIALSICWALGLIFMFISVGAVYVVLVVMLLIVAALSGVGIYNSILHEKYKRMIPDIALFLVTCSCGVFLM